ncbi:MAG: SPOR domain-containing protein [Treponema sp.]|nr:SPOR domain-containing protein [Treponema sp.]
MKWVKRIFCTVFLLISLPIFGLSGASDIKKEALKKGSVQETISYIKTQLGKCTSSDKRSLLYYVGSLLESCGEYQDAAKSYADAATISAGNAEGMPSVSQEELLLCAVRSSLSCGNWETADSYLTDSLKNSKDAKIKATAELYSAWSLLCRAKNVSETGNAVSKLKAIRDNAAMKMVRPQALFTLWFVTGEKQYSDALKKDYPSSPEYAVVCGKSRLLGTPFWFFVPRAAEEKEALAEQMETKTMTPKPAVTRPAAAKPASPSTKDESTKSGGTKTSQPKTSEQASAKESEMRAPAKTESKPKTETKTETKPAKKVRHQLGLFRDQKNAEDLVKSAKAKGFKAYSYSEVRPSGTTYYIVVVDENAEGTMGKQLRNAGFDCYPVE